MTTEAIRNDGLKGAPDPWAEVDPPVEAEQDRFPRVNWDQAFAKDYSEVDWLPGKIMEHGQQAALVGGGKVGKSLLMHDWMWRAVTGRRFLSDERHEPLRVLYFDRENNLRDLVTRMVTFGAVPRELDRLDYRMFPAFSGALDESPLAVAEFLMIVEESKPDIVVFDTISRFVAGKENDSDTWLSFYRRIHAPLKERGIAGIRLDHMGKDEEKGARGNSAKSQDVDHVWELTRLEESSRTDPETGFETITSKLRLYRTHSRTGLGQDLFWLTRVAQREKGGTWLPGGTRHELTDADREDIREYHEMIQRCVSSLITAGAPGGMGRDKMRDWAAAHGVELPRKATVLADIARSLKAERAA